MRRFLLMLLCSLSLMAAAHAAPTVTYELDPITGLPVEENTATADEDGVIMMGENWGFDEKLDRYVCYVGDESFTAYQPPGILLSQGTRAGFQVPDTLAVEVTRDGNPVEIQDLLYIRDTGSYVLEVSDGEDSFRFPFSIVPALSSRLVEYTLPAGFSIDALYFNEEPQAVKFQNYAEFREEGSYTLTYSADAIQRSFSLSFTADRTAPTLTLTEVTGGEAFGPVSLAGLEEGAVVTVDRDGIVTRETDPETLLEIPGSYHLTVSDEAGNSTEYRFVIHVYVDLNAGVAFFLLFACVVLVIGYSRYVRTHARVG